MTSILGLANLAPMHVTRQRKRKNKNNPTLLQLLREKAGLTIEALANQAGCDTSQVSYWERHAREPRRQFRTAYAHALGIPVGDLGRFIYEASVKDQEPAGAK